MFKSILLATDGSAHARKATKVAATLAATFNAKLTIASVSSLSLNVDEIEHLPQARRFPNAVKQEIKHLRDVLSHALVAGDAPYASIPAPNSALTALADVLIDEAEGIAKRNKATKIERAPLIGSAADEILSQAKTSKADLIVMGTRGLSDLGGLVMGSVSHRVIHLAPCACLTVK